MPGHVVWSFLVMTQFSSYSSPVSAHSTDSCVSMEYTDYLEDQLCPSYSCRSKCNSSFEALTDKGIQQLCKCDEKCRLFNDCCRDFVSVCPETHQAGKLKYPVQSILTSCLGDMAVVQEVRKFGQKVPTESPRALIPAWMKLLWKMSQPQLDQEQAMSGPFYWLHTGSDNDHYDVTSARQFSAFLGTGYVDLGHWRVPKLGDGVKVFVNVSDSVNGGRLCLRNRYIQCRLCEVQEHSDTTCYHGVSRGNPFTVNRFSKRRKRANPPQLSCSMATMSYFTTGLLEVNVKVTITAEALSNVSTLRSNDLPWSVVQCRGQGESSITCLTRSCALGRILSADKRDCYLLSDVKVFVVERENSTASPALSRPGNLSAQTQNASFFPPGLNDSLSNTTQPQHKLTSPKRRPASAMLCLELSQALKQHKRWDIARIYMHKSCWFKLKIDNQKRQRNPDLKAETGSKSENENWNRERGEGKRTINPDSHREEESDGNSFEEGFGDFEDERVGAKSQNSQTSSQRQQHIAEHTRIRSESKTDDRHGVDEAWDLIRNHLDALPDATDLQALELCMTTKPDTGCLYNLQPESCEKRSSWCTVYQLMQDSQEVSAVDSLCPPDYLCPVCVFAAFLIASTSV